MWYLGSTPIVERNHGLVVSLFLFITLAYIVVSMRVYTRFILVRNLGLDDMLMVLALLGSTAFLTATMYQVRFGLGSAVNLDQLKQFLIALYTTIVSYSFTQLTVKFSITMQYMRIFQTSLARRLLTIFAVWLGTYGLFCVGSSIITCWPIAKYWDDTIEGSCINRSNLHYALAAFNILNDFALLFFPIPYLRSLQIAPKAKAVLMGVFACGAFACIVSIIRLRSLHQFNVVAIDEQPSVGVDIAVWSGLEINIAIICASVPALKALFKKYMPGLSSLGGGSNSKAYGRSTNGSHPLQSRDAHVHIGAAHGYGARGDVSTSSSSGPDGRKIQGIQVQQSIEMKSIPVDDDDSEKNLVNVSTSWVADVSSRPAKSGGMQGRASMPRGPDAV